MKRAQRGGGRISTLETVGAQKSAGRCDVTLKVAPLGAGDCSTALPCTDQEAQRILFKVALAKPFGKVCYFSIYYQLF